MSVYHLCYCLQSLKSLIYLKLIRKKFSTTLQLSSTTLHSRSLPLKDHHKDKSLSIYQNQNHKDSIKLKKTHPQQTLKKCNNLKISFLERLRRTFLDLFSTEPNHFHN